MRFRVDSKLIMPSCIYSGKVLLDFGIYILNYTKLNATIFVYCVKFYYLCI